MNTITTAPARLRITHAECEGALIRFDSTTPPTTPVDNPLRDSLHAPGRPRRRASAGAPESLTETADTCGAAWAHGEHYAMVAISVPEHRAATSNAPPSQAYERLITCVRPVGPSLPAADLELFLRHQRRRGRRRTLPALLRRPRARRGRPFQRSAAGRHRHRRQREHRPVAGDRACARARRRSRWRTRARRRPGDIRASSARFRRAFRAARCSTPTATTPRLLASGTASIVGHVSQHVDDVAAQLVESLANLEALLAEGSARRGANLQLRRLRGACACTCAIRPTCRSRRRAIASSGLPAERVVYLQGDVCRRELRSNSKACSRRADASAAAADYAGLRPARPRPARGRWADPTGAVRGRCPQPPRVARSASLTSTRSMRRPEVATETGGAVIPPAELPAFGVVQAIAVVQAERLQPPQRGAFGGGGQDAFVVPDRGSCTSRSSGAMLKSPSTTRLRMRAHSPASQPCTASIQRSL